MENATTGVAQQEARARIEACIAKLIELRAAGDVDGLVRYAAPDIVFKTGIGRAAGLLRMLSMKLTRMSTWLTERTAQPPHS